MPGKEREFTLTLLVVLMFGATLFAVLAGFHLYRVVIDETALVLDDDNEGKSRRPSSAVKENHAGIVERIRTRFLITGLIYIILLFLVASIAAKRIIRTYHQRKLHLESTLFRQQHDFRHLVDNLGEIVYTLVTDLIRNSFIPNDGNRTDGHIGFSQEIADYLQELKKFNYQNIYLHPKTKTNLPLIQNCYETLFAHYLTQLKNGHTTKPVDIMTDMDASYLASHKPAAMVCDYIAGMTDDFFLKQAASVGCKVPEKQ